MYNLSIRKCTEVEIFQMKIYHPPGIDPGPAEPEADMLLSEPARRAKCPKVEHFQ